MRYGYDACIYDACPAAAAAAPPIENMSKFRYGPTNQRKRRFYELDMSSNPISMELSSTIFLNLLVSQ